MMEKVRQVDRQLEEKRMTVYNVMEKVVYDVVMKYKDELHLPCTCERCLDDVMAIALNELPPRYIANDDHSPYIRASHEADRQGATNILTKVAQGAALVSKGPRCGFVLEPKFENEELPN